MNCGMLTYNFIHCYCSDAYKWILEIRADLFRCENVEIEERKFINFVLTNSIKFIIKITKVSIHSNSFYVPFLELDDVFVAIDNINLCNYVRVGMELNGKGKEKLQIILTKY